LHLGVNDGDLEILASTLTTDDVGDASQVLDLLGQIEDDVDSFTGDGAYDDEDVYDSVEARDPESPARVVIPPCKNAVLSKTANSSPTQRDRHIIVICEHGRETWEATSGYGRRLLAENAVYRYKTIIGRHLHARDPSCQRTETLLGCKAINKMTRLGMRDSDRVGQCATTAREECAHAVHSCNKALYRTKSSAFLHREELL
jgi:hypothetical protein